MQKCKATKRNGQQCGNKALPGSQYCHIHSHYNNSSIRPKIWLLAKKILNLGLISLIVTIIWNVYQDRKIEKNRFEDQAYDFKPQIKVIGKPEIVKISLTNPRKSKEESNQHSYLAQYSFLSKLTFVIEENGAHLFCKSLVDTTYFDYEIRRWLLSKKERERRFKAIPFSDFFIHQTYSAGDTFSVTFPYTIQRISEGNKTILHYLLLFQNDRGFLYDIYYWIELKIDPIPVTIKNKPYGEMKIKMPKVGIAHKDIKNSIHFGKDGFDEYVYKKNETEDLVKWFDSRMDKLDRSPKTIQLSTNRTLIINPATEEETWEINTNIKYSNFQPIQNALAYIWFDTIDTCLADLENIDKRCGPYKITFDIVPYVDLPISIPKIRLFSIKNDYNNIYKHSVVTYEDNIGNRHRSSLTESLYVEGKRIEWIKIGEN